MASVSARAELDELSRRFLSGESSSIHRFREVVRPLVVGITRRHAPELVEDQYEDVIQQMMMLALEQGARFNPARGDTVGFIGLLAKRAARDVSAQYTPAGRQTRPPSKRDEEALEEYKRKSQVISVEDLTPKNISVASDFATAVDARLDADYIFSVARPELQYGMRRVFYEDVSVVQVARELGIPRTTYNRMFADLRETIAA